MTRHDNLLLTLAAGFIAYGVYALIRWVKGMIDRRKRKDPWQRRTLIDGEARGFEVSGRTDKRD